MARHKSERLTISRLGPIREADVEFGDLTVIVGPQATGKSIFLQALKLVIDRARVHDTFQHHNVVFDGRADAFLDGYFGKGMSSAWSDKSSLSWMGKAMSLPAMAKSTPSRSRYEKVFFIPAQRVMSLAGGVSQNFGQFNYGDPFVLRAFSDAVHGLLQNEFGARAELFPQANRLNPTLRDPIAEHLSTHSTVVLDMVWALREFQQLGGTEADVRDLFDLPAAPKAKELGEVALQKHYRVYFFDRSAKARDISALDPGAQTVAEAHWGGLAGFAARTGDVVAKVVNRHDAQSSRRGRGKTGAEAGA
jgi:hypothetical protein